jgi:hypothetical protein
MLFNTATSLRTKDGGAFLLKRGMSALWGIRLEDRASDSPSSPIELGHGLLRLPDLFRFLQRLGFQGNITVDYSGPTGLGGLRRSLDYARQVWAAVRP